MKSPQTMTWLAEPDEADRERLRSALSDRGKRDFATVRGIASRRWRESDVRNIGKVIEQAHGEADGRDAMLAAGLAPVRLLVLAARTFAHMAQTLSGAGVRHGIALAVDVVEYQPTMVWLESNYGSAPATQDGQQPYDAVLLAEDAASLGLMPNLGLGAGEAQFLDDIVDGTATVIERLLRSVAGTVLIQTLPEDLARPAANIDAGVPGSHRRLVRSYNERVAQLAVEKGAHLFDLAALVNIIGSKQWWPGRFKHIAKLPFAMAHAPQYLDGIARLIAAGCGKSRRVLVLDLDNTLWGGVIGDDGLDGIEMSQGNAVGEAHLAVQQMALDLKSRGIVLCVASKNTDDIALEAFRKHPDMLIKEDDVAVFQINWNDKAANIQQMAETLDLGLESFVFLDDNPAERKRVRDALPMVAVPEIPKDPSDWPVVFAEAGYFEQLSLTTEDMERSTYYVGNARRRDVQNKISDEGAFLKTLRMELSAQPFDTIGRKRIAQLISKSNQFNLTTRRYSEAEIADLEENPNTITLQVRLKDTFGDNGMISAVVMRVDQTVATIDLWIMSCRVIGRSVEAAILSILVEQAQSRGVEKIIGIYRPTARNALVKEHYSKLGFSAAQGNADNEQQWTLSPAQYARPELPFESVRTDLSTSQ